MIYAFFRCRIMLLLFAAPILSSANGADLVQVDSGMLEGMAAADPSIRLFKGVPYAQPPVGELRWKEPQPLKSWEGVRKAMEWGNRCAQGQMFSDIYSRETGSSEDCLYLHIWTPAKSSNAKKIPVYVWFHGGGFAVGSGGEGRYDGEYFARQGIVVVNVNHRLGVFGFFSHPELTKESPNKASGNYGLLDQAAALRWVKKNIGAFGGDPNNVTIGGESAGSISVCGLMASPLSKDLFQKAIGESGSFLTAQGASSNLKPLSETELAGVNFAESIGAKSLADLRAMSAENLLAAVGKSRGMSFWPNIDGYFFPASPNEIYAKGQQARVPLLAGWNSSEMGMMAKMQKPTAATFPNSLKQQFKEKADQAIKLYPASTDEEAMQSAADLASDSFIVFVTWKWIEEHVRTGKAPIYRFLFSRFTPPADGSRSYGAAHASEIPYAFNTLDLYKDAGRAPEDRQTARTMSAYWASFIKSGNPNGKSLPHWPEFGGTRQVMNIDVISKAEPEKHRDRYEFADSLNK